MQVLLLCRYTIRGASSRMRSLQYVESLRQRGFHIEVHSLLDDHYLDHLYTGTPLPVAGMLSSFFKRIFLVLTSRRWDIVWVEKEVLPWFPAWIEKLLLARSRVLVLDYDDAIFHRYDQHRHRIVRRLLGKKIARLMERADLVITGNPYLAKYAEQAKAHRVETLPTAVDTDLYQPRKPTTGGKSTFTLGWIGTPHTARYLENLSGVFRKLHQTGPIEFHFIGAPAGMALGVPYLSPEWCEETEVAELQQLDCGIMPLNDNPFERGKCGYKIIQYFACGIPAVASPVGVNTSIVQPGKNGYLASDETQWITHIEQLRSQPEIARKLGREGRRLVEQHYATSIALDRIETLLRSLNDSSRR